MGDGVRRPVADVLATHASALMERPGVVGVAEGRTDDGTPCVVVLVSGVTVPALPSELDGHPVEVRRSGDITAP